MSRIAVVASAVAVLWSASCASAVRDAVTTPSEAAPVLADDAGDVARDAAPGVVDPRPRVDRDGYVDDGGAGTGNTEVAELPDEDPFAALDRAFAAEAAALSASPADVGGAGGEDAEVAELADEDPFAALDRAFAAEAAALSAPEPATLAEWTRAVNASVTAAEDAAGEAEAAAGGPGTRLSRRAACAGSRDRLARALDDVRDLTVGESRPAYVTRAAGEEAYAELGERIAVARERGRTACEVI